MLIYSPEDACTLKDHYFIFPFRCSKCEKIFALEKGTIQKNWYYKSFDCFFGGQKYYKYCEICSKDEIARAENNGSGRRREDYL